MKTILITGPSSFIGMNLLRTLIQDENYLLLLLVRRSSDLTQITSFPDRYKLFFAEDLLKEKSLSEYRIDVIIHLATCYINKHETNQIGEMINTNITLGTLVLETVSLHPELIFINFTSSSIYANKEIYNPQTLYSATKKAFSDILEFYRNRNIFVCIELIIYDTYGKGDSRNKILPLLLKSLFSNEKIDLSPGNQRIRLLHINDLVEAILLLLNSREELSSEVVNYYTLGPEESYSLRELVQLIEKLSSKKINVNFGAREYRQNEIMMPYPVRSYPRGWKPKISLERGLKELIEEGK